MLIWMCALHCEAKPVIDFYRLKKLSHPSEFDCYRHADILCVVSGIGAINMAAATAWSAALFAQNQSTAWINLGVAGHKDLAIGTTTIASKISQVDQPASIYPVPLTRHALTLMPVESQHMENRDYTDQVVFDLEAYAFIKIASRFSPLELCQCIKIISDNTNSPPTRDKAWISELVARSMHDIDDFARALSTITDEYALQGLADNYLQRFLGLAHFTQTQQIQLKKVLPALQAFDPSLDNSHQSVAHLNQAKKILEMLQQNLHWHCEQL